MKTSMIENNRVLSFVKAVTYRLLGSLFTFIISWHLTKSVKVSTSISMLDFTGKIILYYAHERVWERIKSTKLG